MNVQRLILLFESKNVRRKWQKPFFLAGKNVFEHTKKPQAQKPAVLFCCDKNYNISLTASASSVNSLSVMLIFSRL